LVWAAMNQPFGELLFCLPCATLAKIIYNMNIKLVAV
jgi:hypothetical protein